MKLSIITINLNNKSGLDKTIRSVNTQTINDFEYIIIDGDSVDGSIEIIKENSERIDYWISEPDKGIYNAMNKGIVKSHGDYCFFLNSGDYFVNETVLERIFSYDFREDVVFGNLLVFYNETFEGISKGKEKLTFLDIYSSIIKHQSSFIKRQLFNKFGLYNEQLKIVADWEFFLKTVGLGGASYKYIDIDISCFDNNGISNNSGNLTVSERESVINTFLPLMMQSDYEFLLNYGKYEIVTRFAFPRFLLRVMAKGLKILEKHTNR